MSEFWLCYHTSHSPMRGAKTGPTFLTILTSDQTSEVRVQVKTGWANDCCYPTGLPSGLVRELRQVHIQPQQLWLGVKRYKTDMEKSFLTVYCTVLWETCNNQLYFYRTWCTILQFHTILYHTQPAKVWNSIQILMYCTMLFYYLNVWLFQKLKKKGKIGGLEGLRRWSLSS